MFIRREQDWKESETSRTLNRRPETDLSTPSRRYITPGFYVFVRSPAGLAARPASSAEAVIVTEMVISGDVAVSRVLVDGANDRVRRLRFLVRSSDFFPTGDYLSTTETMSRWAGGPGDKPARANEFSRAFK